MKLDYTIIFALDQDLDDTITVQWEDYEMIIVENNKEVEHIINGLA